VGEIITVDNKMQTGYQYEMNFPTLGLKRPSYRLKEKIPPTQTRPGFIPLDL